MFSNILENTFVSMLKVKYLLDSASLDNSDKTIMYRGICLC